MKTIFSTAALTVVMLLTLCPGAGAEQIDLPLSIAPADLSFSQTPNGPARVSLPGYISSAAPDQAALPTRTIRVALPPNVDLTSLSWEFLDLASEVYVARPKGQLEHGRDLRWICPAACPGSRPLTSPHRRGRAQEVQVERLAGIPLLQVIHQPVRPDPAGDGLWLSPRQTLRVRFESKPSKNQPSPPHQATLMRLSRLVDNPQDLPSPSPNRARPGLAVITTSQFRDHSQALDDYVAAREESGFEVFVVTEEEYGIVSGQAPDGRPQKIRAWLQHNSQALNLEYVLMLGNPDPEYGDVPMLKTWPYGPDGNEYLQYIPSDTYYADLDGNWDLDGDGLYGEYNDDRGPGGVDFLAELHVGRIPIYGSPSQADQLLRRAAIYSRARTDTSWRSKILFPGSIVFLENQEEYGAPRMEGGDIAEPLKAESLAEGFQVTTMYEKKGFRPSVYESDLALTTEELIREWNEGYGLIFWFGHGSEDGAYRTIWLNDDNGDLMPNWNEMSSPAYAESINFDRLPYDKPAFVFHGSCSNGTPENAANIAYSQLKSGSIACYASTRVALGSGGRGWEPDGNSADVFTQGYYVTTYLRQGQSAGQALSQSRTQLSDAWWGQYAWHTKLATALYGDPTLTLSNCQTDGDCADGLACNGQETCQLGICAQGPAPDCSDLDSQCTQGQCQEPLGECQAVPQDGLECDDGLFCTVGDTCAQGQCAGLERSCSSLANQCHLGLCDEESRACTADRQPDGEPCQLESGTGVCLAGMCTEPEGDDCDCSASRPGGMLAWILLLATLARPWRRKRK